jgi:hypothetical protein
MNNYSLGSAEIVPIVHFPGKEIDQVISERALRSRNDITYAG